MNAMIASRQSMWNATASNVISDMPSPTIEKTPLVRLDTTRPTSLMTRETITPVGVRLKKLSDWRCRDSFRSDRMSIISFCPMYALR